jgi:hypothetical protein
MLPDVASWRMSSSVAVGAIGASLPSARSVPTMARIELSASAPARSIDDNAFAVTSGARGGHETRRLGLYHDARHVMGDEIVQLACDGITLRLPGSACILGTPLCDRARVHTRRPRRLARQPPAPARRRYRRYRSQ